ncbi:MFS general substrate transporter [Mycena floridula]|nr:MFS general substrate transporter [Mycena floridula]
MASEAQSNVATVVVENATVAPKRDLRFWLVFVALCCTTFLAAIDLGGIGTAAPTIVHDLSGQDFSWVSAAYSLSSAACIPLAGNLAQIFGRRPIVFVAIGVFAAASAICGSAPTMAVLIIGRALQGIGGGGLQALTSIILSDLVPLRERGLFQGITGLIWSLGTMTAPFIAGSLAQRASWRWLFYMNIPMCAAAFVIVYLFLSLRTPREGLWAKLEMVDWLGNVFIMASTCSIMLGLTWGGIQYPWRSPRILVLIIVGGIGMILSVLYESKWPKRPTIPLVVLSNRTSFSGYLGAFLQCMVTMAFGFYLPTWFQSVREASPILSAVYFLPVAAVLSPSGIIQGLIVAKTGRYRLLTCTAWCISLLGVGLMVGVQPGTSIGVIAVYQMIAGVGLGLLFSTTFAVLAPLPLEENAAAVAFLTFLRIFAQAWGVAIGGIILQNALTRRLPPSLIDGLSSDALAYTLIPLIPTLAEPMKSQVKDAFFQSIRLVWIAMEALCALGFFSFFVMKDVPLRNTVDKKWGISEDRKTTHNAEVEKGNVDIALHPIDANEPITGLEVPALARRIS